jgi:hypothetical protein
LKKIIFIFLCSLLLAACSEENNLADTPEEAIETMDRDFIQDMKDVQMVKIDDKRKLVVFEASVDEEREYFVSILEKNKKKWRVTEALGVGNPDRSENETIGGNYLEAGYIDIKNDSLTPQFSNVQYMFKLNNSEKSMWVKVRVMK